MIYYNVTQHLDNYEIIVRSFIRINDVANSVEEINSSLTQFLSRGYDNNATDLTDKLQNLKRQSDLLVTDSFWSKSNQYRLKNFANLLNQFQYEVNQCLLYYQQQKVSLYDEHYNEAIKISGFVTDLARNLTSSELTSYRDEFVKITQSKDLIRSMGRTAFLVSVLCILLFSLFIFTGISMPLQKLAERSRKISSGDFDVSDIHPERKDEIGELMEAYVVMGKNIERLVEEVKTQEEYKRLLQEMELKSLQSQINPHFLFNTLNIISRLAYLEKAHKTEELMHALSKLLRFNLKKVGSHVTLGEELDNIERYLYIQKTRFQDRIRVELEIDERCLDIEIPSLTLQPIVENIFVHGIQSLESDALIRIKVYAENEYVKAQILDNGVGMSSQTIDHLLQKDTGDRLTESDSTGLGINNVIKRLQIFYNTLDVISIQSEIGQGTCIELSLPRNRRMQVV